MNIISEKALLRAAQPTIAAIHQMKKKVEEAFEEVLDEICDRFFEPGFTARELQDTLEADKHWLLAIFHQELGLTPWSFIRECRLEMAARLLRDTSQSVPDVCLLVGYSSISKFRQRFQLWSGLPPWRYRECARGVRSQAGPLLDQAITWIYRERCRRGELSDDEARQLIEYLERLYGLPEDR